MSPQPSLSSLAEAPSSTEAISTPLFDFPIFTDPIASQDYATHSGVSLLIPETPFAAKCPGPKALPGTQQAPSSYFSIRSPAVTRALHREQQNLSTVFFNLAEDFFFFLFITKKLYVAVPLICL